MADLKQSVCAVCLEKKGKYSKSLVKVRPSVASKIKEYIWPEYNAEFNVCPDVICSSCRRNIFLLEKGKSTYLSNWISKVSQVDRPRIRRSTELSDIVQSSHINTKDVESLKKNMCSCCFTLLARGCHNNCCSSQAVLNLINLSETLDPTSCEQVASGIIKNKMEREGIERGQSFKISTGGNPLTLTVGTKDNKSSRKFFNQISFQAVMELTSVLELTKNKTKKLISSLRKNLGSSTVVENNVISMMTSLQEEIESKYNIEQDNFIWNDEIVTRHVVFIHDTSEFILSILMERGLDPLSSMVRISIDGGQGFLKVIVNVFDKTNKNEIYIDSGVKRCFILAIVEDVCEDNGNLQKILSRLNLDDVTYHLAFDLKCANSIFGLSSHSGKYACLWCEGECSLESGTPRTLGSFDHWYNLFVENGAKRLEMKDFKNVISPRLVYLDKNAEDEINHLVPPPELHLLIGIVTLLGRLLLDHWPLFKNWLKEHYILLRGYHGIGFDGNNSNKLLEKVDILERDVLASQTNLLPIVHCLRKFAKVKECTFGYELGSNASSVIEEFKVSFCDLQQYAKIHLNTELKVTWKVHIVVCHILPFVKFNCCSLGSYAEQTGEAVHSAFKPSWSQYKRRIEHKDYAKRLKSATATFCLDKM